MTTSDDLLLDILSMDSYNRGYNVGINITGTTVGNANIGADSLIFNPNRIDEAVNFYAISYTLGSKAIILYRGIKSAFYNNQVAA